MSKIRIGDTLATAGTTIEVPIEIYFIESNVTSLSSYDITINYTANTLDLTNSSKEAIKQTIENNSIINFIPTDTSIFIVDEIISYYVEALSQGEIKISAYITDSFLLTGAPIKPAEITSAKPYTLGKLQIQIPSIAKGGLITPFTTTIRTATLFGFIAGNYDPIQIRTTEVINGSVKILDLDTTSPVFTSISTSSINENIGANQQVYLAAAKDESTLTFSLKDSADKSALSIEETSGKVFLNFNPNYENPSDSDKNNTYYFTVIATDAKGNKSEKKVILGIKNIDEGPFISGDVDRIALEDSVFSGLLNANDPEGIAINFIYSIASGKNPTNGTATIAAATGKWNYTPNRNLNGSDSFSILITDDKGGTTEQLINPTISAIDDPALISGDLSKTGIEDSTITGTISATDPEGLTDGSIYSIASGKNPTNGTATIAAATGKWNYTPNPNFNGSDSFSVLITDDKGGTTEQLINLSISGIDDPALI